MLFIAFFSWWYGAGWQRLAGQFPRRAAHIQQAFSVQLLSRTLFQPWRRIISYSSGGLSNKFRALADNAVSRIIGALVRSLVLIAAVLMLGLSAVFTLLELLIWPLLPLAPLALVIAGFTL